MLAICLIFYNCASKVVPLSEIFGKCNFPIMIHGSSAVMYQISARTTPITNILLGYCCSLNPQNTTKVSTIIFYKGNCVESWKKLKGETERPCQLLQLMLLPFFSPLPLLSFLSLFFSLSSSFLLSSCLLSI